MPYVRRHLNSAIPNVDGSWLKRVQRCHSGLHRPLWLLSHLHWWLSLSWVFNEHTRWSVGSRGWRAQSRYRYLIRRSIEARNCMSRRWRFQKGDSDPPFREPPPFYVEMRSKNRQSSRTDIMDRILSSIAYIATSYIYIHISIVLPYIHSITCVYSSCPAGFDSIRADRL